MNITQMIIDTLSRENLKAEQDKAAKLEAYFNLIIKYNKDFNLVSRTSTKESIINKHFLSSFKFVSCLNEINMKQKIIDIGTGAGFPGIIIAMFFKESEVTLVDSLNKRTKFLQIVKQELSLNNVKIQNERAEVLGHNKDYRETFDIALCRAVAHIKILIEYAMPLIKTKGCFLAIKSSAQINEIENSKKAIESVGGKINIQDMNEDLMCIVKKMRKTDPKYPRNTNQIAKSKL